jgi:hypothetical protein
MKIEQRLQQLKLNFEVLPKSGVGHLTEKHLPIVLEILELSKPKKILEFGFNAGHSSTMWLTLTDAEVISADPGHSHVWVGANELKDRFGSRFKFFNVSSQDEYFYTELLRLQYAPELTFVDGDHSQTGCYKDLELAYKMNSEYILVDNLEDGALDAAVNQFIDDGYPYKILFTREITDFNQKLGLLKRVLND